KLVTEEHGQEKQLTRLRISPRCQWIGSAVALTLGLLAGAAARPPAWIASEALLLNATLPLVPSLRDCGLAFGLASWAANDFGMENGQAVSPENSPVQPLATMAPAYFHELQD